MESYGSWPECGTKWLMQQAGLQNWQGLLLSLVAGVGQSGSAPLAPYCRVNPSFLFKQTG